MSREIKFRTWMVLERRFFLPIYEFYQGKLDDILMVPWNGVMVRRTLNRTLDYLPPETVIQNQFTGVRDDRGTEVYEDDIVAWDHTCGPDDRGLSVVVFWQGAFRAKDSYPLDAFEDREFLGGKFLVVGNIHEDAYLLSQPAVPV